MTTQNTSQNTIQNTGDLLDFLVKQMGERKDWFGRSQQKLTAVSLAHKIAENHASQMNPVEVVNYVQALNQEIFDKIIKG
jgi:two-component sensor histidine kinase